MIKTYSLSKDSNTKLSANFTVKEFKCNDNTDKILIDIDLVNLLQKIRTHFNKPVTINSAYRTPTYNKKVGGASNSQHLKGTAADIVVSGVSPVIVAMYAEEIVAGGVGLYDNFVHIDTRSVKYRWIMLNNTQQAVSKMLPTIRQGISNSSYAVKLLQRKLGLSQSGTIGDNTTKAIKEFQAANKLVVDGVVGIKTWSELYA
jgi:uncharacterized membrane protein YqhA